MSRSLGTLTLDLVAKTSGYIAGLDKAERASGKWKKQVERDLKKIGNTFKVGSAIAVGAVTAIAVESVRAATEISKLAGMTAMSAESFQKYAAGAQFLGIEQEKLGDIFRDTSDKIGDFLTTGGGGMADFFETVGKKAGVTADQFRDLSGADALQLYVKTLEDANVSQNEMIFFMEALAGDASTLLPLLKDNAAGFELLGETAESAGAVMSERTIKAAEELNAITFLLGQSTKGTKNQIAQDLLPTLSDLGVLFTDVSSEGAVVATISDTISAALKGASLAAVGAVKVFDLLGSAIGGVAALVVAIPQGFGAVKATFNEVVADLDSTADDYNDVIDKIINAGGRETGEPPANKKVAALADLLGQARNQAGALSQTPLDLGGGDGDDVQKMLDKLKEQQALLGKTAKETELYKLELAGAGKQQLETASNILESIAAFEASQKAAKDAAAELNNINDEVSKIQESLLSEEEHINNSYERRRDLVLKNTKVTGDAQTELLAKLEQERQDQLGAIEEKRREKVLAGTEQLFGGLADLAKQFKGEQSGIFKAMFAVEKAVSVARSIVAIQAAIAQASSQPFPANIGAVAQVVSLTAGVVQTIQGTQIEGVAHAGLDSVPKTGTYLLEKGERVTTERTSAKLDATLNRVERGDMNKPAGGDIRINNVVDPSFVGDYMGGKAGDRIIDNYIARNQTKLQRIARG